MNMQTKKEKLSELIAITKPNLKFELEFKRNKQINGWYLTIGKVDEKQEIIFLGENAEIAKSEIVWQAFLA